MKDKLYLEDDSGDKKYFTIIPNFVLNHSTIWDREVYIQMKRIAGENGTCWTSKPNLAKKCGISKRKLDSSILYLLKNNWIQKIGLKKIETKGGLQEVVEYKICDLWHLNNEFYKNKVVHKGGAPETPPDNQRGCTDEAKGGAYGAPKEEPYINKNPNTAEAEQSSAGVPLIIKAFEEINPACKRMYGNTTQRRACDDLLETYGFEEVSKVISILSKTNKLPFFPNIQTPKQLWDKYQSLKDKFEQKKKELSEKNNKVAF